MAASFDAPRHVYIVDDDVDLRTELADALAHRGFSVATFGAGEAFLGAAEALTPGCIVLDLNLPGIDGIAIQERLGECGSAHKVVMLTGAATVSKAVRALHAGAVDFIEKPFRTEAIAQAIGRALQRQRAEEQDGERRRFARTAIARLSLREQEVLMGLVLGLANKIIAYRLDLSTRTVETYRAHVMDKLQVRSLSEAVRLALDAGLDTGGPIMRDGAAR